ncbi:Maf family protein [Sphingorhabdus contaminans]|uniref:Nucleoside triphosphate pyrophosphatase n=1 Tax=Sphingorhabdus contaminans TaxID=1343899 RepID=A0A553WBB1_9SPHN|nr:nucleoside triphosphate pyrophosphatase [Sphingorhabdus contaminans]TSB01966.1 septum formation protein Maf [Sphingorhabdus contaminans]
MKLILASQSAGREAMLRKAGVSLEVVPASVDEHSIKDLLIANDAKPREIADALAEAKALKVSRKYPAALVLGCDQIAVTADGKILDKPDNPDVARAHLSQLSNKTHRLISAAVICEAGQPIWRVIDSAQMTVRHLSPTFIDHYVANYWEDIRHCVGCYRIEAEGAQLFKSVSGSHFTIIGLPLLPVLDYLRLRGLLPS